jgi:uncharacterized iron-regulated protein
MRMRFVVLPLLLLFLFIPGAVLQAAEITIWDVAGKAEISLEQAAEKFPSPGIVYVGEFHDNAAHHAGQLAVIQSLDKRKRPLAVGLEMFQHIEQSILDAWVAKALSEEEMRRAFARNWSQDWHLYRDIFLYCRDRRIPMVGLNVPRSITRKVAQNGFASLTPEEIGKLPPIVCRVDREYEDFLRRVLGSHGSESGFRRFCEAQLVWDTAMAIYALEYLNDPSRTHGCRSLRHDPRLEESRARAGRPGECRCRAGRDPTRRERPLDARKRLRGRRRLPDSRPGGIAPASGRASSGF